MQDKKIREHQKLDYSGLETAGPEKLLYKTMGSLQTGLREKWFEFVVYLLIKLFNKTIRLLQQASSRRSTTCKDSHVISENKI